MKRVLIAGSLRGMKLVSWNVNGLRAVLKKEFLKYMQQEDADVLCLQETKCHPGDVFEVAWPEGYESYWSAALKKGYSGTAVFTRQKPLSVSLGIGLPGPDDEGRAITLEFPKFYLLNVYVPNAQPGLARIDFRMEWDRALLKYMKKLEKAKPVVLCGDMNVAHEEIDLARPKENRGEPGFSDQEREGFGEYIKAGFIDTFRELEKGGGFYTWWSYRAAARERNVGWRIDYFLMSESLRPKLKKAWIEPQVMGSDHCPVGIELSV